jgi:uncharacterized membrane protein YphA (DoxX/SURF4 family)
MAQAALALHRGGAFHTVAPAVLAGTAGALLLVGLWTPIAGVTVAAIALWSTFAGSGDPRIYILLASIGMAMALLGPGAYSVDAHLFGWKRIDIRDRQS